MTAPIRYLPRLIVGKHLGLVQCKQYSARAQYKAIQIEPIKMLVDNREHSNDVLTRMHLTQLTASRLYAQEQLKENVVLSNDSNREGAETGRPSPEKLAHVFKVLSETLPKLFVQPLDYTIYHDGIIFEDNIRKLRCQGLMNYVKQMALIRTVAHLKFAYVKLEILKITQHPEDGTVRVRWRIRGISAFKVMFQFWKYKLWKWKENIDNSESWYDGYSTFIVNADGRVVKHVADKMMPDSDSLPVEPDLNNAKLALFVAVLPSTDVGLFM